MELDPNFSEFIGFLNAHETRYLLVGGYAVAYHGHPRYTADLDIWIWVDRDNAQRVLGALTDFGFGDLGLTVEDFTTSDHVVQLGYPPLRIDLLTGLDGVAFEDAYERRVDAVIGEVPVSVISLTDLRRNKEATGRARDRADLEALGNDGP